MSLKIQNSHQAQLFINLSAIAENYDILQKKAQNSALHPVIKADAYGLGAKNILPILEKKNSSCYFVANLQEALDIRAYTKKPIAILNGIFEQDYETALSHKLIPVINSLSDLKLWQGYARIKNTAMQVIIHFDTGMNRLGFTEAETKILLENQTYLEGIDLHSIMSHLACADTDHDKNLQQATLFQNIRAHFPDVPASLAATAGIFRHDDFHLDIVRPGMGLYGLNPDLKKQNPFKNILNLKAPILQIKTVRAGETIGYGASYKARENLRIAIIGLGYADGFFRTLENQKSAVLIEDEKCPVIGRVSMDLIAVDITHLKELPKISAHADILNDAQNVDMLAKSAGTIGYEILTNLGNRFIRHYHQ